MTGCELLRMSKILFVLWCSFGFIVMPTWFIALHIKNKFPQMWTMQDFFWRVNNFIKNVYAPLLLSLTLIFLAAHLILG